MSNLQVKEIKAFVPAKDYELSKQFYVDMGFTLASDGGGVAYFYFEQVSFLLQDCSAEDYAEGHAENFMMHLLVSDVDAWWNKINQSDLVSKYQVTLLPIELHPWKMRDFCLTDPSGVQWRIAQNVD